MQYNNTTSNFKIIELIGYGGMANIYKALQISLDRTVALKKLHPHLTQNVNFTARFEKEAKAAASLKHENIVGIIDFGKDQEGYYIVMEYVEGLSLKDILEEYKKVPPEVALIIAKEIAQGLKYAHDMGLVHRDVKPGNIMLSRDGSVKITDFGIVKSSKEVSLTSTGTLLGSPAYMCPEQLRGNVLDKRSDIFSLGIVFYEMLTGFKPFGGENYETVITQILTVNPKSILKINSELTSGLDAIVTKALEKDKERRYQDIELMLEDLDKQIEFYRIYQKRKLIREFLEDPQGFSKKLYEARVKKHLDSGLYFLNLGKGKITDARREFEEVLHLDRENPVAKKYMEKLRMNEETQLGFFSWKKRLDSFAPLSSYWAIYAIMGVLVIYFVIAGAKEIFQAEKASTNFLLPENNVIQARNFCFKIFETAVGAPGRSVIELRNPGFLIVNARPSATVIIDGKISKKVPPPQTIKLSEGEHSVRFVQAGYKEKNKKIKIEKGKTIFIEENLKKTKK